MATGLKSLALRVLQRHSLVSTQSHPVDPGETGVRRSQTTASLLSETSAATGPTSQPSEIARPGSSSPRWWQTGAVCWHCRGRGRCACIDCDIAGVLEVRLGPCVVCRGEGRIAERAQ